MLIPNLAGLAPLRVCGGCRRRGGPWCVDCAATVAARPVEARLRPHPEGLGRVVAASAYAGPLREALVAFKDHGRWTLRAPLGRLLARSVAVHALDAGGAEVVLVPVPSTLRSVRERDGEHVRELARSAAFSLRRAGLPVRVASVLRAPRRRADQVGLGREARAANLAGTLRPTAGALELASDDAVVLLVDDLVTTGATLAEAARALAGVGVVALGAAVVATVGAPVAATSGTAPPGSGGPGG